ncbi:ChaN family lipoprotein [Nitrospira sp. Kam-Ns4a]
MGKWFPACTALILIGLLVAPAGRPAEPDSAPTKPLFREWQVLDARTAQPVPFDDWIRDLAATQVIYLGEEHRNRHHVEGALKILRALIARGRRPILALEMFGWDGQPALDRYVADHRTTRERFLQEAHWEQNWGGAFEEYEPLIAFARETGTPVLALNPPRALVRQVAKRGLSQALADPEMMRWGMLNEPLADEPAYRRVLFDQIRRCHDGLSDEAYQRMYEASLFRDEGMAKTIASFLDHPPVGAGPVVSYTGGGHIQYRLPVPNRVQRRRAGTVTQATIYLTAFTPDRVEEIQALLRDGIADYLWLTPLSAHGAPRRCR